MYIFTTIFSLILMQATLLHSIHHEHDHDIVAPHFKYSREANEKQSVYDSHRHPDHHHHHHHHHHDEHHDHHKYPEDRRHTRDEHHFNEEEHHHAHLSGESGHHHHHQQHIKSNQRNDEPYDPNGFGSGGLLGDAFLHLIPHSQPSLHGDHSHSHSHSHAHGDSGHSHGSLNMAVGSYVLAGILAFLTVEKLVRILRSEKMIHSHSHGNGLSSAGNRKKFEKRNKSIRGSKEKKSDVSSAEEDVVGSSDEEHEHLIERTTNDETGFEVAAYLNLVADFAHNFTDGLAIGASFLASTTVGIVTMITVLVHEIPHEIGDFAILIQSGFSKKKAMFVQLLTAFGALSGCILSLLSANGDELSGAASSNWVLPFTAGGFIYIATVTVIPELLKNSSTWQSIKEIVALLTGIVLMFLIAVYE